MQTIDAPAIEWLRFKVPIQSQQEFIEKDREIWTPVLASFPAFVSKEVWIDFENPDFIVCIIRWSSRSQWKAIPEHVLEATNKQFSEAFGKEYALVEAKEFKALI